MPSFTLGRKVDPRYKTNLIILIMTITLIIARGLLTNDWRGSLVFSAGFFLTWALAREIDPLYEKSAFVAAFIYLSMAMWIADVNLGVVFWTVLLLRVITRITGKKTTVLDLLGLMGLTIYLIIGQGNGIYGLVFTAAMLIGYRRFANEAIFKVFMLVGLVVSVWGLYSHSILQLGEAWQMDTFRVMLLLVGLASGVFYGRMLQKDQGIQDDLGNLIESKYVFLSYIFYLGMYAALLIGTDLGQGTVSLFFSVILGVALYRVWLWRALR
ncbi:MAG: hypothetical protein SCK57_12100 [Bacillota bacterium]|nr:hypothetical protein [Bacillota bacterium]MDW7678395.1 hypothetical protein [Bacillota bacterium]